MKIKALTSAVLSGLLRPMLGERQRGLGARGRQGALAWWSTRSWRAAESDYESLITVAVTTERQERSVSGTVYADGKPRLVDIKGIRVDAEFGRSMIYVTNEDKRAFIGKFASLLGDAKINIATLPSRPRQAGRRRHRAGRGRRHGAGRSLDQGAGAAAGEAGQGAGVLASGGFAQRRFAGCVRATRMTPSMRVRSSIDV